MDKYKKLASNTMMFSIGSFSSKILSILLVRLYTSYMTDEMYSTTSNIQTLINLLEPVASLSMAEAIVRYGVDKSVKKDKLFSSAFFMCLVGVMASMLLFPLISLYKDFQPYISLMVVFLFTSAFRWLYQQQVKVKEYTRLYTIDGILSVFTLTLFNIIFIIALRMGIKGYILSLIISDICSIIFLHKFGNIKEDLHFKSIDMRLARKMVDYSLPIIPTKILWWIVGSSDGFMVKEFVGPGENGVYQVSYKIPNLISTISSMFFYAWQMSAISEYDSKQRKSFYTNVLEAYVAIMFVGSAGMMMVLKFATSILAGSEDFLSAYKFSPLLIIGVLFMSFSMFFSTIYNATNNNKRSLVSSMWAAGINFALNLLFIPMFKVQGAAAATMIAYFVCFMIRAIDTQQIAGFDIKWRSIIVDTVVLVFMAVVIIAGFPFMQLWLVIGFILMSLYNLKFILQTVKRVLKR